MPAADAEPPVDGGGSRPSRRLARLSYPVALAVHMVLLVAFFALLPLAVRHGHGPPRPTAWTAVLAAQGLVVPACVIVAIAWRRRRWRLPVYLGLLVMCLSAPLAVWIIDTFLRTLGP